MSVNEAVEQSRPTYLKAEEIKNYLEDIFHECATKDNNEIEVLD
ncbi:hypothetical protein QUF72_12830 [Desulfobacterales bacterium HSG2]|nr:hypothetical protein [Desulfobacterales bacterium HSG2]